MTHQTKLIFAATAVGLIVSTSVWAVEVQSTVVCQSKQCTDAYNSLAQTFLYKQLGALFLNNIGNKLHVCQADPVSHTCVNKAIEFKVSTGAVDATVFIPDIQILDARELANRGGFAFVSDTSMSINGTYPECQTAMNILHFADNDQVKITTNDFYCNVVGTGLSTMQASYTIDFINLDKGVFGARYEWASGQPSNGSGSGYALLKFDGMAEDFEPSAPSVKMVLDQSQSRDAPPSAVVADEEYIEVIKETPEEKTMREAKEQQDSFDAWVNGPIGYPPLDYKPVYNPPIDYSDLISGGSGYYQYPCMPTYYDESMARHMPGYQPQYYPPCY